MTDKFSRVSRRLTAVQKQRYDEIRRQAEEDFPPLEPPRGPSEKGALRWPSARHAKHKGSRSSNSPSGLDWPMRIRFATSNMARTRNYRNRRARPRPGLAAGIGRGSLVTAMDRADAPIRSAIWDR